MSPAGANLTATRRGFHVMTKATGPICNLDCTYCYYLEKENLYPETKSWAMTEEVLESYVQQYIEAQSTPETHFAWQGGEPTLLGVDFFRKAVEFQKKYANGKTITNALQTNGILLNDTWCSFLAENQFLIGISIDGPKAIHDTYRVDKGGRGTFDRVVRGINLMKRHGVEFNTLTCVHRGNEQKPLEVYRFLKEIGSRYMQFIPIIERVASMPETLSLVQPEYDGDARVSAWSVRSLQYGKFLSAIFDEWVRKDVGRYFVQIFDTALQGWLGLEPGLCVFAETCGNALVMEHNGDLYSCDHYVYPEFKVGNIMDVPLADMVQSGQQAAFGEAKKSTLPKYCVECEVRFACNGECPKHRFIKTPDGDPGLNYLCAGYKHFFNHIDPYMKFMATELRAKRPAANVMRFVQADASLATKEHTLSPNVACPCGSGKKYKKCCGKL
ncbi:MAG: anaerobic sulfatase-maturation protein [Candidatus Hydrogenedentes bacterium]|nr:anaerobic sulfatase-maturation protein [Candidatus Hydrogenedentota bacterium]